MKWKILNLVFLEKLFNVIKKHGLTKYDVIARVFFISAYE